MLRRGVVALALVVAVSAGVPQANPAHAELSQRASSKLIRDSLSLRGAFSLSAQRRNALVPALNSTTSSAPCSFLRSYADPIHDGIANLFDVNRYSISYDCASKRWTVSAHVALSFFLPSLVYSFGAFIDSDQDANTGNEGFDVQILGGWNWPTQRLEGSAVNTPTADQPTWTTRPESISMASDASGNISLSFPDSVIGHPRFDWGLILAAHPIKPDYDVMPNSGLNTTTRPTPAPPKPAPAVLNSSANVFRPSTGTWYSRGGHSTQFGQVGDVPVPADYFGDHKRHVAVFRPSNGTWYVHGGRTTRFGQAGDVPVAADFNGDGKADIAVFRPSNGTWYIAGHRGLRYGAPGDVPVAADFNGDGKAEIAVFRPSNGTWFVRGGHTYHWGLVGDVPIARDFNGDGASEITIFRPSNARWYIRNVQNVSYGQNGDIPL